MLTKKLSRDSKVIECLACKKTNSRHEQRLTRGKVDWLPLMHTFNLITELKRVALAKYKT